MHLRARGCNYKGAKQDTAPAASALVRCCLQQGKGSARLCLWEICDPKWSLSSSGSAQSLIQYLLVIKSASILKQLLARLWFSYSHAD